MTENLKCHSCGDITDFICEDCGEPACEECLETFTLQNRLEGTHCKECYEGEQAIWMLEVQREEEIEDERQRKLKIRRDKAWVKYHSPEQCEKRRIAKEKRLEEERLYAIERAKEMREIMKWFRF